MDDENTMTLRLVDDGLVTVVRGEPYFISKADAMYWPNERILLISRNYNANEFFVGAAPPEGEYSAFNMNAPDHTIMAFSELVLRANKKGRESLKREINVLLTPATT